MTIQIHNGCCLEVLKIIPRDSVQSVYIDPPFNSGRKFTLTPNSSLGFDDIWKNDEYVIFIKTMIAQIKPLMKKTASLFFHISSDKMFAPEVLLRQHFKHVKPIFWKKCRSKNNVKRTLGSSIDIIFWCWDNPKRKMNMVYQKRDAYYEEHSFKNKDARGNYALGHLATDNTRTGYKYIYTINGVEFNPNNGWRISQEALDKLKAEDRLHIPKKKGAKLYKKVYLHESPGKPCMDLWDDIYALAQGNEKRKYPTAKPQKLLERIIQMSTDEEDIVLDPVAGSGTTGIACKNLGRQCIMIEKNPEAIEIIKKRLE